MSDTEVPGSPENDNSGPKTEREIRIATGLLPTFWQRFLEVREFMAKKVTDSAIPVEIETPDEEELS